MYVGASLEANAQATKLMQPCIGPLYHPPRDTQTTAMLGTSSCNYGGYPALPQCGTVGIGVVSAVALQRFGFALRMADLAGDRRNAVNEWQQLSDVGRWRP